MNTPASRIPPPASKRGGRRPGAGAPRGNLNALKHGRRSPRLQATQAVLDALRRSAPEIARLAQAERRKRELIAHALRILADLILAYPASQTTQDILPTLIPRAALRAKRLAQTTEQPDPISPPRPTTLDPRPPTATLDPQPLFLVPCSLFLAIITLP